MRLQYKPSDSTMADDDEKTAPAGQQISFHFIKSGQFRVIRVDGGHGGVTPTCQVQVALYSERLPIPQKTVHCVTPEGKLEENPIEIVSRDGLVREVEVEAVMDPSTARSLGDFLLKRAEEAEKQYRALRAKEEPHQ